MLRIIASLSNLLKRRGISRIIFELNRGLGSNITISIGITNIYNIQLGIIIIIKLTVTKIAYSGPIILIIIFTFTIITIIIIIVYTVALNLRDTNINTIVIFVSVVTGTNVTLIEAILNTIINNGFIDYTD